MTVNNDRNYFKSHHEYHMFLHPEYPNTDSGIGLASDPEEAKTSLNNVWLADWKFFTSDVTLSSPNVNGEFQELKLDKKIIGKIYRENAIRWFKIDAAPAISGH